MVGDHMCSGTGLEQPSVLGRERMVLCHQLPALLCCTVTGDLTLAKEHSLAALKFLLLHLQDTDGVVLWSDFPLLLFSSAHELTHSHVGLVCCFLCQPRNPATSNLCSLLVQVESPVCREPETR